MIPDVTASTGNDAELFYADIATFGKAPLRDHSDLAGVDVAAYGIPWDTTSSPRQGARLGPRRIREASAFFKGVWSPDGAPTVSIDLDRPRKRDSLTLADCGDVTVYPYDIQRTRESIQRLSAAIAAQTFPIALGGDHYVMFPAYQGVCDAHPGAKIGIVTIDAHDDTGDDDPILGKHWAGTPFQRSIEYGAIDPRAVAMLGLRNFFGESQLRRHREEGFVVFSAAQTREAGIEAAAEQAIDSVLRHCDLIYLTLDIDGADPSCAPGTASPSPGGFLAHEFIPLVRALGGREEVVAADLVEVAPDLDPTEQTPLFAAHALFHLIEARFLA
jgi:agmatinase